MQYPACCPGFNIDYFGYQARIVFMTKHYLVGGRVYLCESWSYQTNHQMHAEHMQAFRSYMAGEDLHLSHAWACQGMACSCP